MRNRTLGLVVASFVLAAGASACGAPPSASSEESVGETSEAVLNGTPVGSDRLGSVMLWQCGSGAASCCSSGAASCSTSSSGFKGGCSGTMIADKWLLTAGHCANTTESTSGGGTALPASQLVTISGDRASMASGDHVYLHPSLDVALVHLTGSITNAAGAAFSTPIYQGTSASLIGRNVYCQGYGVSDAASTLSTYGMLRSATLNVNNAITGWMALTENSSSQLLSPGDSGTGCFLYAPTVRKTAPFPIILFNSVVGVQSLEFPNSDNVVGADGFASWADSVMSCAAQSATCGTVTDPAGNTVSCGACSTGSVCLQNHCLWIIPIHLNDEGAEASRAE
ncbi:MAG TPA: trypsin-like serine protease [Polyangiaceae bacterium]